MTKRSYPFLFCLLTTLMVQAQSLTGKLIDENNQPLPYANVVLLALPDSSFVTGTVSAEDGTFALQAGCDNRLVRVSSIGYTTLYERCTGADLGILQLQPDAQMLGEVVVKADLPKMRIKGDAQITTVQGSVLEKAGTGNDLLNKISGVSAEEGSVNVFGSGTAEIYINGRKMRDASELDQLESDNIKSVEVVRNPGARYDASVQAVVRIFTKKAQGEGFGFNNRFSTDYRYGWSVLDQFDFNYRKGGFDLSGMLYGSNRHNEDNKGLVQETFLDYTWRQESDMVTKGHSQNLSAMLALNYQFNDRHSLGVRYDYDCTPQNKWEMDDLPTTVYRDGDRYETTATSGWEDRRITMHSLNAYYNGRVGDWNIDFNADGLWSDSKTPQDILERVTASDGTAEEQRITSRTLMEDRLYAAKLILAHPLWGGNFSVGGEYTYNTHTNQYNNEEGVLEDDDSKIRENAVSAFLEYARSFGKLQATVGVRYEHLVSDYFEMGQRVDEQSRTYDNVFPAVSLAMPVGKVQLQLSYSGSINRPTYRMLRSSVSYLNRYTYESGNPTLKPNLMNRLSLNASYKWVYLNLRYVHLRDGFLYYSSQYSEENPTVSLIRFVNTYDADRLYATLTLAPTIGLWSPQFTAMLVQQWFPVDTPWGQEDFNNPYARFTWRNSFSLPAGFRLDVDLDAKTRGENESYRLEEGTCSLDVAVYKEFFDERLSIQLKGTDLFNSSRVPVTLYSGNRLMTIDQESRRRITLTLRYKFNAAKSKYKGTGAGQEQKNRM